MQGNITELIKSKPNAYVFFGILKPFVKHTSSIYFDIKVLFDFDSKFKN